jgi:small subunit ribosomal protein S1
MAEENVGQPSANPEDETPVDGSPGEIEDELSPIDTMEILSRAGRPHPEEAEAPDAPPPETPVESPPSEETVAVAEAPAEPESVVEAEAGDEQEDEEFESLLEEYLEKIHEYDSGDIIDAEIVDVKRAYVLVDVGDKAEGVIDINEFVDAEGEINVSVGDTIPVQIEGRDEETGQVNVSHRRAAGELAWQRVREAVKRRIPVTGRVVREVRAGLIVDIGLPAFMPASQIDTSRVEKLGEWVDREVAAYVIDLDRQRKRVVLSRRKLVEEDEERKRRHVLESLEPGEERVVRVKKILDFGAFADLGGLDGLIPREEVSWERGSHPKEYLREGRDLKVRVLNVDQESGKVSLSRKRVRPDPWETIEEKYPPDTVVKGKVVGLADFGAFVNLEEGVRGMIHSSDLSWASGRQRVKDFLSVGDKVQAVVLDVDKDRRRMSLGLKQISKDPWLEIEEQFQPGTTVKGTVTALTNYGAFVRLTEYIEGLIHISDMSWDKKPKEPATYVKEGEEVEAVVLRSDRERRRISLGMKQLSKSPFERFTSENPVGSYVRGKVTNVAPFGAFVQLAPEVEGLVHISQLDDQRVENPGEVVKAGDTVEAKIIKIDRRNQRIGLSRRQFLKDQESREVESYMNQSVSGGQNMGELLRGLDIRPVDEE